MTDTVANFINGIKTASRARREAVLLPYSKLTAAVSDLLAREGYVKAAVKRGKKVHKFIEVRLAYDGGKPKIVDIRRHSKPSRRLYLAFRNIRPVRGGFGKLVLSTTRGIMTGEEARKAHLGGEPLFKIW